MKRLAMICLVLAAAASPALGASARTLGLDEMIDLSEEIVRGEVTGSSARWQGKLIVTDTTVRVDEAMKGAPPREITLTQLGGTAVHPRLGAAVRMEASSFTAMAAGEAVVLFVDRKGAVRRLVGAQQGKLVLREDTAAKKPAVAVGPKRLRVLSEAREGPIGATGMTLDELRARVRTRVEGGRR
jgi:hypothetical protein